MKVLVETSPHAYVERNIQGADDRMASFWVGKTQFCHVWDAPDGRWVYRPDWPLKAPDVDVVQAPDRRRSD